MDRLYSILILKIDNFHNQFNCRLRIQLAVFWHLICSLPNLDKDSLKIAYHGFPLGIALAMTNSPALFMIPDSLLALGQ